MTKAKEELLGQLVHEKLRNMAKTYGVMMTGVPAEVLGQMQAERSLPRIYKTGNIRQQISQEVAKMSHMMTEPTQSCGQASNDVCELFLGKEITEKFHSIKYEELSEDGTNLKKAVENHNSTLIVRFEVDRANYPTEMIKVKSEDFNQDTCRRNKIYLLENNLFFLDRLGKLFDLGQSEKKCAELFNAVGVPMEYSLCDPFVLDEPEKPEDFAICDIVKIFNQQKDTLDCWLGSHSFTLYFPKAFDKSSFQFYPYQAYFGSHTLQDWFASDKDEYLSTIGFNSYIEKLVTLARTENIKQRSDIYGELFSKRGRELYFCAHLNERREQLRVKFKIAEVNPIVALKNLQDLQEFIDTYPGENASEKVDYYRSRAKNAMTGHLEDLLQVKSDVNPSSFWKNTNIRPEAIDWRVYSKKLDMCI